MKAVPLLASLLLLAGCGPEPDRVLGTLEWDRITLPAPAAEPVTRLAVREGERVMPGQILVQLDDGLARARWAAAEAEVQRRRQLLAELRAGPRPETIAVARAALAAARAEEREALAQYRRLRTLEQNGHVSRADSDAARAAAESAGARAEAAQAALLELQRGTRPEQLAQAEAALAQARGEAEALLLQLQKLTLRAPRAGWVDSLPFKAGDEAPVGGPLATLLVGDSPYARVYVPAPLRPGIGVGDPARVVVPGVEPGFRGRVRMIRGEPGFTPYYALTGEDAARLSYLAEIQLGEDAAGLPAGLPLSVTFEEAADAR